MSTTVISTPLPGKAPAWAIKGLEASVVSRNYT
jgi:hypothetical protein